MSGVLMILAGTWRGEALARMSALILFFQVVGQLAAGLQLDKEDDPHVVFPFLADHDAVVDLLHRLHDR